MKISTLFFTSSIFIGLAYLVSKKPSLTRERQEELIQQIVIRSVAALKSCELAMEKSNASYLRENASLLHASLQQELVKALDAQDEDQLTELNSATEEFRFYYEYDEAQAFDLAYIKHQRAQCDTLIAALQRLTRSVDVNIKEIAQRNLAIFSRYYSALKYFHENFLSVDEHRIRDFAHQIWESEGRPEGQAARHWAMAVELSKKLTPAELQLAFEEKRSAVDLLSTSRFDPASGTETIH